MIVLKEIFYSIHRMWTIFKPTRIRWKKLSADGKMPVRAYPTDGGFDVHCVEAIHMEAGAHVNVGCGIAIQVGPGWSYDLRGRSGLTRIGILAGLGLVDAEYCGEIRVVLSNFSGAPYIINPGERIGQIKINPVWELPWQEVTDFDHKPGTRGSNGWGSSGK